jgi:hypothetical protein
VLLEGIRELLDPDKKKIDFRPISWMNFEKYSTSKIILSVVGLSENSHSRNEVRFSRPIADTSFQKPIAPLDLKLLYASYSTNSSEYLEGIHQLHEIRTYFFENPIIEIHGNSMMIDLINLNSEEEFQLWRMLQVPYLPYLLFRLRILPQN